MDLKKLPRICKKINGKPFSPPPPVFAPSQRREVGAPACNIDFDSTGDCQEAFSFINLRMDAQEAKDYFNDPDTAPYGSKQIIRLKIPIPNQSDRTFCFDVLELYKWISENPRANLDAGYVCALTPAQKKRIIDLAQWFHADLGIRDERKQCGVSDEIIAYVRQNNNPNDMIAHLLQFISVGEGRNNRQIISNWSNRTRDERRMTNKWPSIDIR